MSIFGWLFAGVNTVLGWIGISITAQMFQWILLAGLGTAVFFGGCSMGRGSSTKSAFKSGWNQAVDKAYSIGYDHGTTDHRRWTHPTLWIRPPGSGLFGNPEHEQNEQETHEEDPQEHAHTH